ncbi:unnamed protein product [Notodromas monacha]|uniref:Importin-13 n=1 Tax=Notodromas monacha TaxID=399045 RepID=A0A7R9G9U3_9CRUS|nr:unnamed protein product [Notodromas monacha]CAG0914618.1 unnamed protein product [Notodromas monacha]
MERITSQQVEHAVNEFYVGGASQLQVHQWLKQAQCAPEMWEIVWTLLEKEGSSVEVKFFSAKALHLKITNSWSDVPLDQQDNLKQKLVELIERHVAGPKVVLTRLLMCSCSFIIHCILEQQSDAVKDFLSAMVLTRSNSPTLLLQLLTLLPEETEAANCKAEQRVTLKVELRKSLGNVLELIKEILEQEMASGEVGDASVDALRCLLAWIQFGISLDVLEPVCPIVLSSVGQAATCESALEVLSAMLTEAGSCASKLPETTFRIVSKLLSVEALLDQAEQTGATDMCRSIFSALLPVGEANSKLILQWLASDEGHEKRAVAIQFITLVLRCSAAPGHFPTDEAHSDQAFGFWYNLQDALSSFSWPYSSPGDDECQRRKESCEALLAPIQRSLVEVLLRKSCYAPDYDTWADDERESFRCYRQDIGDALVQCFEALGVELVRLLEAALMAGAARLQASNGQDWAPLEAAVHAYGHVAECLCRPQCDGIVPAVLLCLPCLVSSNNRHLLCSLFTMLGALAEWLELNPEFLPAVVHVLLPALAVPELATPASLAIKAITCDCWEALQPFKDDILTHCMSAMKSGKLRSSECVRLMYPVGRMLGSLPVDATLSAYLSTCLAPLVGDVQALLGQQPTEAVRDALVVQLRMFAMLAFSLDMDTARRTTQCVSVDEDPTTALMQPQEHAAQQQQQRGLKRRIAEGGGGLEVEEPIAQNRTGQAVVLMLQQLLPTLKVVVQHWAADPNVIEAVCNLVAKTLLSLDAGSSPALLADLIVTISTMYQLNPHPAVLDLCKNLFVLYDNNNNNKNNRPLQLQHGISGSTENNNAVATSRSDANNAALTAFLSQICSSTLVAFEATQDVREHSDMLEAFLVLLSQALRKRPALVLGNAALNHGAVFQLAVLALGLPEHGVAKAAASYLVSFVDHAKDTPALYNLLVADPCSPADIGAGGGAVLVDRIVKCAASDAVRSVLPCLAEVLLTLNKRFPDLLSRLLPVAAASSSSSSSMCPGDSEKARVVFVSGVLRERSSKARMAELVVNFASACRGLMNTEYGRQTSAMLIKDASGGSGRSPNPPMILWTALSVVLGIETRAEIIRGLPCVKMLHQLLCTRPGNTYPSQAIERFIDENKALIRRMYGEFSSPAEFFSFRGKRDSGPYEEFFASDIGQNSSSPDDFHQKFTNVDEIMRVRRATSPTSGPSASGQASAPPAINTDSSRVDACQSKTEVVTPYWASNSAGKIRAIVNTQHFEQAIYQEICQTGRQTSRCQGGCSCEQKYKWHRLLAYDPDNDCAGIFMDWFLFPSCCVCRCNIS